MAMIIQRPRSIRCDHKKCGKCKHYNGTPIWDEEYCNLFNRRVNNGTRVKLCLQSEERYASLYEAIVSNGHI